jgi:hypothetical protein
MKRVGLIVLAVFFCASMVFAGGGKQQGGAGAPKYHIGIMTGTVSQSDDDLRGAEELIRRYGSVAQGGMIQHVTYPDIVD